MFNVTIPANSAWRIAGPDQATGWNAIVAPGPFGAAEADGSVQVFCYDPAGRLLGATAKLALTGNKPNVSGPNEQYGVASALGAAGPCSLTFYTGAAPVSVTVHGL